MRRLPPIWRDRNGMALLITIMVVSLLVGVTVQFNRNVRQGFFASASRLEGQRLLGIARSGVAMGVALLEADGVEDRGDNLNDVWAVDDPESFAELFERGQVAVAVEDLSGRLPINSLVVQEGGGEDDAAKVNEIREILNQLLVSSILEDGGEEQAREIIDSLVDWLDPDEEESEFGAEAGYYRSLGSAVTCRNGPIRDVDELLLVKGMTPRILYGEGGRPGLIDYITVHGDDAMMNLNTMPRLLMQALHPLMTEELADVLDEYRRAEEHNEQLGDAGWYQGVDGFPGDIVFPAKVLTASSTYFLIRGEGRLDDQVRRVVAVAERGKDGDVAIIETRME